MLCWFFTSLWISIWWANSQDYYINKVALCLIEDSGAYLSHCCTSFIPAALYKNFSGAGLKTPNWTVKIWWVSHKRGSCTTFAPWWENRPFSLALAEWDLGDGDNCQQSFSAAQVRPAFGPVGCKTQLKKILRTSPTRTGKVLLSKCLRRRELRWHQ